MIRKSDGGFGYGTTDMATLKQRIHVSITPVAPSSSPCDLLILRPPAAGHVCDSLHCVSLGFSAVHVCSFHEWDRRAPTTEDLGQGGSSW